MRRRRLSILIALGLTVAAGCGRQGWVDDGVPAAAGAPGPPVSSAPASGAAAATAGPGGASGVPNGALAASGAAAGSTAAPARTAAAVPGSNARVAVSVTGAGSGPGSSPASNAAPSAAAGTGTGTPASAMTPGGRPSAGADNGPASTSAPAPAGPPANSPARPGRSGPAIGFPATGHYVYDLSGSTSAGPVPPTGTLQVSDAGAAQQRWSTDARDAHGDGWTETFVVDRADDGLRLASYRLEYVSLVHVVIEFDVNPPAVFAPRPLTPGRTWSFDATTKDGCYRVHSDGTVGAVDAAVPGGAYHGHRLDTTATVADTGQAGCHSVELRQERATWFDGATSLAVRDETRTAGRFSSVPFHSDVTAVLRSTAAR